ncbi:hypothetical protein BFW01_g9152 [Lasiodiplodia theobromae]|uniref:uncharacterized protein n=1 Tax=Lasiodiplodia theobromae TaxID=45133 RepID=UPI0015C3A697|nr:uncharacterized protein LTHEOB_3580 [Lasiodiplodia theobromae]KAF4533967.1 hypothetical protein LTHEOB_3580 [Lasiodiplodia theobromae]KAF9638255.1 hypothetical protein BFW01_g9152 [Lasiodiplodia theobromae]
MSGNPFRRSQPPPALHPASPDGFRPAAEQLPAADQKAPARTKKHVRLASPPASPPEPSSPEIDNNLARRLGAARHAPSPPPPADSSDGSDGGIVHELSDESPVDQDFPDDNAPLKPAASGQLARGGRSSGVPNPFERTLANIDPSTRQEDLESERTNPGGAGRSVGHKTRGSMDVDSFKRLLMTGSAHLPSADEPIPSEAQPRANITIGGDTSSGTDASSASKNSMFDSVLRAHDDTPRSSLERTSFDGANEDDRSTLIGAEQTRAKQKPPPPKHRHGKSITRAPQTVSFSDFSPSVASPTAKSDVPKRTSSNGQKPLPPRPRVPPGQKQKDHPSSPPVEPVPAKDAAESPESSDEAMENSPPVKTPEVSAPQRRKPPTPPIARRHSQLKSSDARSRSNSAATMSSQPDAPLSPAEQPPTTSAPPTSFNKPPPPPPSRRSGATSSSTVDLNAVSRSSSRRSTASSMQNPSLNIRSNRLSGSALDISSPTGAGPPPPPPRRGSSKSSFEMQRPSASVLAAAAGEGRRSSGEFKNRSRTASGASERVLGGYAVKEEDLTSPNAAGGVGGTDLLSELDKLQQEVEALRQKSTTKA